MVKVRALPEAAALDREGLAHWFADLPTPLERSDRERLLTACHLLGDRGNSENRSTLDWAGEAEPLTVGLEIVQILAELRLGSDALLAGLLYRSVRQQAVDVETVRSEFGGQVAGLLDGVLRMAAVSDLTDTSDAPVLGQSMAPNMNIRRMLIAMVDDVRVALIKLAERTVAMSWSRSY